MNLFQSGILYRLPLYILYGLTAEFLFTALADLINPSFLKSWNVFSKPPTKQYDPKAIGYSFLWMLPIYALLVFIEPASVLMKNFPWAVRGILYVLALWLIEYASGWLIKKISGKCPWDYSASRWNLGGFIRLDFFPIWFVFMLTAEWLSRKFILLTPALKQVFL